MIGFLILIRVRQFNLKKKNWKVYQNAKKYTEDFRQTFQLDQI